MAVTIEDLPQAPDWLLSLLAGHLPYSLPTFRRLQIARRVKGASSPSTHVLLAFSANDPPTDGAVPQPARFAAAFVDPSRGPETECWLYSTLEDSVNDGKPPDPVCVEQVLVLLRRMRKIHAEFTAANGSSTAGGGGGAVDGNQEASLNAAAASASQASGVALRTRHPGHILFGAVHESVRQAMLDHGVLMKPTWPLGDGWEHNRKWLFRLEELPGKSNDGGEAGLPAGMRWDAIRDDEDRAVVQSRTGIPRKATTLSLLPSTAIRLDDGTPIAWAFLGLDGSLTSLHCEERYRGRGLAKALAARLMRDHLGDYGDDGWGCADVTFGNHRSDKVCQSLGGKRSWTVSWFWVNLATVGDPL